MNVNELRVNQTYILPDGYNRLPSGVTTLSGGNLAVILDYGIAEEISPIRLSQEWGEKLDESQFDFAGFGTRLIYQCVKYPQIKYEFSGNSVAVFFGDELINIKDFVHDWQNIHFALCGEELALNQLAQNNKLTQ